jgi:predicted metal-dependent TIM-barrel fold hydrolase
MQIIQPHYHAIARTAQDYEKMAMSGVIAVCEPAFWAGFDRHYPETFIDYFRQISEFEPTRAAQYGIRHYSWIAVNPKEAENKQLTAEVLKAMPEFLENPLVLGVGETGLHKSTPNECDSLAAHVELAMAHDHLVLIHTPHLSDKAHGIKLPKAAKKPCFGPLSAPTPDAASASPAAISTKTGRTRISAKPSSTPSAGFQKSKSPPLA